MGPRGVPKPRPEKGPIFGKVWGRFWYPFWSQFWDKKSCNLEGPKRHRKINDFPNAQKCTKIVELIDQTFGIPFGIYLSTLRENGESVLQVARAHGLSHKRFLFSEIRMFV